MFMSNYSSPSLANYYIYEFDDFFTACTDRKYIEIVKTMIFQITAHCVLAKGARCAIASKETETSRLCFLRLESLKQFDPNEFTTLACRYGCREILNYLISHGATNVQECIHHACISGSTEILKDLLTIDPKLKILSKSIHTLRSLKHIHCINFLFQKNKIQNYVPFKKFAHVLRLFQEGLSLKCLQYFTNPRLFRKVLLFVQQLNLHITIIPCPVDLLKLIRSYLYPSDSFKLINEYLPLTPHELSVIKYETTRRITIGGFVN